MAISLKRFNAVMEFNAGLQELHNQGYAHMTFSVNCGREWELKRALFAVGGRYLGQYGNGVVKGMCTRGHVEAVLASNQWPELQYCLD